MKMNSYWRWIVVISAVVSMAALGCGDDEVEGDNGAPNQSSNQGDPSNQEPGDDECEEGEQPNPITGECVAGEEDNQGGEPANGGNSGDNGEDNQEPDNQAPDNRNDDVPNQAPNGQNSGEDEECGPGSVVGQTCRPDGGAIPGATVTATGFDCDGDPFEQETTADGNGNYGFDELPAGEHTITITPGSFEAEEEVIIVTGQETDRESIGEKICLTGSEAAIAVVDGVYDDISSILDDIEVDHNVYSSPGMLLDDLDAMNEYDIIFMECDSGVIGSTGFDADFDEAEFNIGRYVDEGGSMYASDWSSAYLQFGFPDPFNFYHDQGGYADPRAGDTDTSLDVQVPNSGMRDALDLDDGETTQVSMNTASWSVLESVNDDVTIHLEAPEIVKMDGDNLDDIPIMSQYFSPLNDGSAIFTSFHNNAQVDDDMQEILEFMIFQL